MKEFISDILDCYGEEKIRLRKTPATSNQRIYALANTKAGKENVIMNKTHRRLPVILVAIVAVVMLMGAGVVAGLLSASDVASRVGETTLAEYFENGGGEAFGIESQTSGGYTISILGIASGDDLSTYYDEIGLDKTYIVGSVERADGEAITDYTDITVSPVISGYEPWLVNIFTLGDGSKQMFIQDGVEYFLVETTNVSIFADHTVYIAAYSGTLAPTSDAFTLNEDGSISVIATEGVHALFEIPLDESLADPEVAEEIIASIY